MDMLVVNELGKGKFARKGEFFDISAAMSDDPGIAETNIRVYVNKPEEIADTNSHQKK